MGSNARSPPPARRPGSARARPGFARNRASDVCPPATWLVEVRDADGGDGLVYEGSYPGFEIYKHQTARALAQEAAESLHKLGPYRREPAEIAAWLAHHDR